MAEKVYVKRDFVKESELMFNDDAGMPKAQILTIGNEIISGLIDDSNAAEISRRLQSIGVDVLRMASVGDDEKEIVRALREAIKAVDIVIVTGGLGATHDDITKQVLARYFKSPLTRDEKVYAMLEKFFSSRGKAIPELALVQCDVPEKAMILYNEKGTAPGLLFQEEGKMIFSLPGVPAEMIHLLDGQVLPMLASENALKVSHRLLNTAGISESGLWEKIGPLERFDNKVVIASLPSHLGVRIRLSVVGADGPESLRQLDAAEKFFRDKIPGFIYGVDEETLEGNLGQRLREKKLTLALAESCTGGLIGHRITNISGSSDYFLEGAVTYTNSSKTKRLGVDPELIRRHGAVSREVALAMAAGVRKVAGADLGVAVTGIAGPAGGGETKPVGLTYIALSDADTEKCERYVFIQDRISNKEKTAQAALNLLRLHLRD